MFLRVINNNQVVVRNETMEGRDFLVVPMVMLVEGVHNGSNGPLYYSPEEIEKSVPLWNQRPVVVYHPEDESGNGTFAGMTPELVTEYKVGVIMNTTFEDGKLKAEAWLEESRLEEINSTILVAIQNSNMLEVSTGLLTDNIQTAGNWNDEPYSAITTNYKPDHLAILPDQKGACSISDGAGLLRNNEQPETKAEHTSLFSRFMNLFSKNEASHNDVRAQLYGIVNAMSTDERYIWIEDIFETYFVYEDDGSMFRMNYNIGENEQVSIEGAPEKVIRSVEYKTVTGAPISNVTSNQGKEMNKTQMVDSLIVNGAYEETDRSMLDGLDETVLERMVAVQPTSNEQVTPAAEPETVTEKPPVINEEVTVDSYIANAPTEIQAVLRASLAANASAKDTLIGKITANANCAYTKDQLEMKDVSELEIICNLMVPAAAPVDAPTPLFAAGAITPVANADDTGEAPLEMPVMNFEREA